MLKTIKRSSAEYALGYHSGILASTECASGGHSSILTSAEYALGSHSIIRQHMNKLFKFKTLKEEK
jgi:hypothetical protein